MKIQAINTFNNYNLNYKACNKYAKYTVSSLYAAATLFIAGYAVEPSQEAAFHNENHAAIALNSAASIFSVIGTALGIVALKKEDV